VAKGVLAKTTVVALPGEAYRGARKRFHNLVLELLVEPITAALLTTQFSNFYRGLKEGVRFDLLLLRDKGRVQIILLLEHKNLKLAQPLNLGNRLQLGSTTSLPSGHWVTEVSIPLAATGAVDEERCQSILSQRSSEELNHEVLSTSAVLNRVREELSIAADIQRSFLVSERDLNRLSYGLDLGALMVPSKEVGGDLYDCIPLGEERYLICLGDVSGKGVPAALTMSTCLTLVRSYCEVFDSPSSIMKRVNQRLCRNNSGCAFTTLFLAVLDARNGELRYCNGGHNPALILRSSGLVERLSLVHGPALGVANDVDYGETTLAILEEETLLVYSDGASEMFDSQHRRYGLDGMETFFSGIVVNSSSRLIRKFMRSLRDFAGGEPQHDDITLLAARLLPRTGYARDKDAFVITILNQMDHLNQVKLELDSFAKSHLISTSLLRRMKVVCDELLSNLIRHGCSHMPEDTLIELRLLLVTDHLRIQLRDPGLAFNPMEFPDPDLSQSLEDRPIGGLGLHLVHKIVSDYHYQRIDDFNVLDLVMKL
jgi:sigma-B regulation protein RsbU (phosphoserine phosphatase)